MILGLVGLGFLIIVFGFILSMGRLLNCLIVLENFNVLILFSSLILLGGDSRMFFVSLLVIFTIEVTLSLVVLTRLWSYSELLDVTSV